MPSLRISHVGLGREHVNGRVHYFLDPRDATGPKAAPEAVVLKRWRQRALDGYTFSGARLSSTIWRAMAFIWMDQVSEIPFLKELGLDARVFRFKEPKGQMGLKKKPSH